MNRWEEIAEARRRGMIDGFTAALGVVGAVTLGCLWLAGMI